MIQGATIRRPKPQRTITDATTRLASQNQAGSERAIAVVSARRRAVALAAKPDLVEEPRDLRCLLAFLVDPHLRRRLGHLADDRVADGLGPDRLLQRGHVRLGRALEVVLGGDVRAS